ncbi:MAG: FAD-binding protein [Alphaproteobacteria bacterium]|nr:FAD-binding protein [Alphaproteobacteria bacterium]
MRVVGGRWSNWSGGVSCRPQAIVAPKDEVELAAAIRKAEGQVRVPGSGHSFNPLNATDGTLIDLSAFTGLQGCDPGSERATIAAATPLWGIGSLLHPLGYALKNMGDIDRQTLGGAVGTGTHGTGRTLGSFSAEVASFRLVLASGEVVHCSPTENVEIFAAGRTALGLLGVMTEIDMKVRPVYKLAERQFLHPISELFRQLDGLVTANRHFEFFWFPYADVAVCKSLNVTNANAPTRHSAKTLRMKGERRTAAEYVYAASNEVLPRLPFLTGPMHRLFSKFMPGQERVRWSHEIFPNTRTVRFNEVEYAVPYQKGPDVVREIAEMIRKRKIVTGFPIEYRTVAADDVWLSPFYERASATIAVHQYWRFNSTELFEACEAIFRGYGGRPHWGKLHTRAANELAALYPKFEDFKAVRRRLDPKGKFLNDYLRGSFA